MLTRGHSLWTARGIADLMIVHVCHVRRDGRVRNPRSDSMRNPPTNQRRKSFFGSHRRPNNGTGWQLNVAA